MPENYFHVLFLNLAFVKYFFPRLSLIVWFIVMVQKKKIVLSLKLSGNPEKYGFYVFYDFYENGKEPNSKTLEIETIPVEKICQSSLVIFIFSKSTISL